MKKPGRKLQKRTMGLLRNLMILGVSFVGLTVVLQLEIEYNLLVLIYALSAVAVLLYQLIRNRSDRDKLDQAGLLYDFNHDPFWATRDMDWPVPMGVYSDDGMLTTIPASSVWIDAGHELNGGPLETLAESYYASSYRGVDLELSMAYEKRWIQSYEWHYDRIQHPAYSEGVPKKYGYFVIRKEDVTW